MEVRNIIEDKCKWIPTEINLIDDSWTKYAKRIPENEDYFVNLDLLTSNFSNIFLEDNSKKIPYKICFLTGNHENRNVYDIPVNVPIKELLVLLKLKAYRDRNINYNKAVEKGDEKKMSYYESKKNKDVSDVIALIDPQYEAIDTFKLSNLIKTNNLQFILDTFSRFELESNAISQYNNLSWSDVEPWLVKIYEDLKAFI